MAKSTTPRTRKTNGSSKPAAETPVVQTAAAARTDMPKIPNSFIATQIDMENQIRQRAYELYQERGCTPGHQDEDWLRAEQEVRVHNGNHHA